MACSPRSALLRPVVTRRTVCSRAQRWRVTEPTGYNQFGEVTTYTAAYSSNLFSLLDTGTAAEGLPKGSKP